MPKAGKGGPEQPPRAAASRELERPACGWDGLALTLEGRLGRAGEGGAPAYRRFYRRALIFSGG